MSPFRRLFASICSCLLYSCLLVQSKKPSLTRLFRNESAYPSIPKSLTVGAYYYPWHAHDFHRRNGYVRKDLDPPHEITLGEYNDRQEQVIAQHLAWSRQANVGLWVCSWWGPHKREDITISEFILKSKHLKDHKVALFYESKNRIPLQDNQVMDTSRVKPDMEHICRTYFHHENYFRVHGKPVIVMYLSRDLTTTGLLPKVSSLMRETARQTCNEEIYIVGDQVWKDAPNPDMNYDPFQHLDAITNYNVYGHYNSTNYATIDAVDWYYNRQQQWRQRAHDHGVEYIPAVTPGYNDRGVRLQEDHTVLSRSLLNDEPGSFLVAQLLRARSLVDEHVGNLLFVNSFNEWHEDTQIEPCHGEPTSEPVQHTQGVEHTGYGELYLNILCAATTVQGNCHDETEQQGSKQEL